jgi:ABC-type nitrate/sulfonate/bicarbonate transport system substrate-binding protein
MLKVNIGGVPEHFNLPWYLKLKDGSFKAEGINLRWHDCYGGTGEMCAALRSNTIDMAVILTEGIVKDIIEGNPAKIVQTYIASPLIWGIHVAEQSQFNKPAELKGKRAAISRYGSGSHLMAYVHAESLGWNLHTDLDFKLVDSLDGGVEALLNDEADYFLWESFTTKPYVDNGIFRKVGDCPTPWPCFVIAVSENFLHAHSHQLSSILNIINTCTVGFKSIPDIDRMISNRYQQKIEDVQTWLSLTEWSQSVPEESMINEVQSKLLALSIIKHKKSFKEIVERL